jgi:hypothetical protein
MTLDSIIIWMRARPVWIGWPLWSCGPILSLEASQSARPREFAEQMIRKKVGSETGASGGASSDSIMSIVFPARDKAQDMYMHTLRVIVTR